VAAPEKNPRWGYTFLIMIKETHSIGALNRKIE
jgi:hypothetical protein